MADTIINDFDGTFKTEGSVGMEEARNFLALREGLDNTSFEGSNAGSISLKQLYDASNAGGITLAGNAAFPTDKYSLGGLRGASYQNNTAPTLSLLGPLAFYISNVVQSFGIPESYALNMQACAPGVDFETDNWRYDNEHYVATYTYVASIVRYDQGWPYSIAIAWTIRSFFYGEDSDSSPSYDSSGWKNPLGDNILNAMDANFKNNLFYSPYNVGYIARKVHILELWDNGPNYYQVAWYKMYSDIYNDNRPNYSGTWEARSYTDTTNGGYTLGKFCTGPSSWTTSTYYDPFQPSAIAYKQKKGSGFLGATDEHIEIFNNTSVNHAALGYYLHPIRKAT